MTVDVSFVSLDSDHHCGGQKIRLISFFPKKTHFQLISITKHSTNTLGTPRNQFINLLNPKTA
jgi:hypothetical protein